MILPLKGVAQETEIYVKYSMIYHAYWVRMAGSGYTVWRAGFGGVRLAITFIV